jgi:hypothetical protein
MARGAVQDRVGQVCGRLARGRPLCGGHWRMPVGTTENYLSFSKDMTQKDIAYQRLWHQLVLHQPYENPVDVVRHMMAMQSQNYNAGIWAIGMRIPANKATKAAVEKAIEEGVIVRSWPMRGTLHFVAAEDIRWMLRLLTPKIIKSSVGRYKELELDQKDFDMSQKLIENALVKHHILRRSELYALLEENGIATPQRGYHIIGHLAMNGIICFGSKIEKEDTFVLLEEWIENHKELEGEEALAELARRYIHSRGPVAVADFATWAGMSMNDAERGFGMVKSCFNQSEVSGKTYFFADLPDGLESYMKSKPAFWLPAFDEMLCGYKSREAIFEGDNYKKVITKNGIFFPIIFSDGKVIGHWQKKEKKEFMDLYVHFFKMPSKGTIKKLEKAVKRLEEFSGNTIKLLWNN